VLLDAAAASSLADRLDVQAWRCDEETGERCAVVAGIAGAVPQDPWPPLPPDALPAEQVYGWLLPPVFQRLESGQGEFLAELRPAVALFLRFDGIDYDGDPAAGEKLDLFVREVEGILGRYEASLLNLTIGDKGSYLYASFGAPISHEDDGARAASAALELRTLGTSLGFLAGLQIGLATGRMRTGAYGSRTRRTYSALGDAVNLAARLMDAAAPGQILVSEPLRRRIGGAYAWEELPPIQVKGKGEPVAVSGLVGLRERPTIRLLEPRYALPMVGRQGELDQITRKLDLVLQGKGQIVGITAEAGMGKSRLGAEVILRAREAGLMGYGGEGQSYGTTTSYLVWHTIWRGLFELDPAASLEMQVDSLTDRLRATDPRLLPRLPLLGAVLNLAIPDNELTRSLEAKVRKSSLEGLLVDCLRARAREHPLLLVLEDCHWLDPLSHDLVEEIGRAIADVPVLLLLIYRPPDVQRLQAPRVSELPHFTEVALSEFSPEEAGRLIDLKVEQFFGLDADVPAGFVAQITERAAGNPFFIEELLNYLQDRGIHPGDSGALATLELPSSLHSLILSRMDQLTERQQITMKVASVIGRLFPAAVVWGAYPQLGSYEQVRADLQVLSELDIAPLDTPEPELSYLFKHIVTQEVAYESLLHATRAVLHEQIGRYIERAHADRLDEQINLLAFHYERSENVDKKREYLLRAAEAARARYANEAALQYYQTLLPLLADAERGAVLLELGQVWELIGRWEEAGDCYEATLSLAERLGDRHGQARSETALGELQRKQGAYDRATEWLTKAQARFEELGDEAGVGQALHYAGTVVDQQGDHKAANELWQESLTIRRRLDDKPAIGGLLSNLGIVAARQGHTEAAQSLLEESLAVRREIDDRWAIAVTLNNIGFLALLQDRPDDARGPLEEAVVLQREVGDRWMIGNALNNLGNVARAQGRYEEAAALYGESLGIYRILDDKYALAYLLEDMASLAALQAEAGRALHLAGAASALREEIGGPLTAAEASQLEAALEPARRALDAETQAVVWAEGRAMPLDEVIHRALSD